MRDIGRAVKVTDAAIYYYFRSKREILDELLEGEFRIDVGCDEPAPRMQHHLAPVVERIVDRAIESVEAKGDLLTIILREALAGDALALRRYREVLDVWEGDVAAVIRRWNEGRSSVINDPLALAREMVCIIAMGIEDTLLFRRDGCISPRERRRNLRRFLTRDLTAILDRAIGCSPPECDGHSAIR